MIIFLSTTTLFDLLKEGGWAMYPLGSLFFILIALIIYIFARTSEKQIGLMGKDSSSTNMAKDILTVSQELKVSIEDSLDRAEAGLLSWIQYLNVVATISPMVGLLGTVSGMIGAFQTIAAGGMGKPEKLAGDIGEALITTATGLVIGIPAMVFFFILRNRLEKRMQALSDLLINGTQQPEDL